MSHHRDDDDDWSTDVSLIVDPAVLQRLEAMMEDVGPVIVEHRFYRGARSPDLLVFRSFEDLETYLRDKTRPGDLVYVWQFDACCREDNFVENGKIPDAQGRAPRRGAY